VPLFYYKPIDSLVGVKVGQEFLKATLFFNKDERDAAKEATGKNYAKYTSRTTYISTCRLLVMRQPPLHLGDTLPLVFSLIF
jgi:hypothetical protein